MTCGCVTPMSSDAGSDRGVVGSAQGDLAFTSRGYSHIPADRRAHHPLRDRSLTPGPVRPSPSLLSGVGPLFTGKNCEIHEQSLSIALLPTERGLAQRCSSQSCAPRFNTALTIEL